MVDVCVTTRYVGEVESVLLSMTPFSGLMDGLLSKVETQRRDPLIALERTRSARPESPFFAQIHLINPHPPYFRTGETVSFRWCQVNRQPPTAARSMWMQ